MSVDHRIPETLQEAIKYFGDYANAHAFMVNIRWPGGEVCCPCCGSVRVRYIQTRRQWECRESHPKRRFSLKTGTTMEESPLPLEKWLACLWVEVNCKNSISSWEVHRHLGVAQKSAWFMLHRVRHALHVGSFTTKMTGTVEADESFVGGKIQNMSKSKQRAIRAQYNKPGKPVKIGGRMPLNKTLLMGLLQRGEGDQCSTVRVMPIQTAKSHEVQGVVREHVEPGSNLMADTFSSYRALKEDFLHQTVNHAIRYVNGRVHTNGLENFWSLLKRGLKGTHISVYPSHLFRYVDSEAYRFNHRLENDRGRFVGAANSIVGKRLTYEALINTPPLEGCTAV